MKRASVPSLLAVLAVLFVPVHSAAAAPALCDSTTAVTLIGIDTTTGRMLFSVAPLGPHDKPWIAELAADGSSARAVAAPPPGLFSGSVGPGPVLAAVPCGRDCLQPMRWEGKTWNPLGDQVTVPSAANLSMTYDATGSAWLLLQGPAAPNGLVKTWAWSLEGKEWTSHGSLDVTAVGQPPVLPAAARRAGVISGSGLFSASGPPETWVAGLPDVPAERRGAVIALSDTSAAYLSADGVVYLSGDAGRKWRRSVWTPWGSTEAVGSWRQGTDYWVDQPAGDPRGTLRLVWFDRRNPSEERILLTEMTSTGWVRLADSASEVRSKNGEALPVTQVLAPRGGTWILLSGCAATAEGSGLVLRVYDGKEISPPRFVPFTVGSGE
jgi:hypothetical protein